MKEQIQTLILTILIVLAVCLFAADTDDTSMFLMSKVLGALLCSLVYYLCKKW